MITDRWRPVASLLPVRAGDLSTPFRQRRTLPEFDPCRRCPAIPACPSSKTATADDLLRYRLHREVLRKGRGLAAGAEACPRPGTYRLLRIREARIACSAAPDGAREHAGRASARTHASLVPGRRGSDTLGLATAGVSCHDGGRRHVRQPVTRRLPAYRRCRAG